MSIAWTLTVNDLGVYYGYWTFKISTTGLMLLLLLLLLLIFTKRNILVKAKIDTFLQCQLRQ